MGLCINTGPKWEDDSLNDLNIESIKENAEEMARKAGNPSSLWLCSKEERSNNEIINSKNNKIKL